VAGYNDSRVQYWEAAKWVAKLRASKTDAHLLLLKTDLDAGHGGMSGRYQGLKDVALEYSFLLKVLGSTPAP
jgi:oligopeptidase B